MVTNKALSLFDNFNQLTPYAVGFDRVFDQLQNYASHNATSSGFPPYNIRKEEGSKCLGNLNHEKRLHEFRVSRI